MYKPNNGEVYTGLVDSKNNGVHFAYMLVFIVAESMVTSMVAAKTSFAAKTHTREAH